MQHITNIVTRKFHYLMKSLPSTNVWSWCAKRRMFVNARNETKAGDKELIYCAPHWAQIQPCRMLYNFTSQQSQNCQRKLSMTFPWCIDQRHTKKLPQYPARRASRCQSSPVSRYSSLSRTRAQPNRISCNATKLRYNGIALYPIVERVARQ